MRRYTFYYIWKLLYMFRVVPPPTIGSAYTCIYSIWYLSHRYCYLPLERHAVAQLVEALRYKSEGRGFGSRWCHWNFLLTWCSLKCYNVAGYRTSASASWCEAFTSFSTRRRSESGSSTPTLKIKFQLLGKSACGDLFWPEFVQHVVLHYLSF
jgi:hypothetical protein